MSKQSSYERVWTPLWTVCDAQIGDGDKKLRTSVARVLNLTWRRHWSVQMYISQTQFFYKEKGIGFSNAYVRKYEMILKIIAESYLGCLIKTHILLFLLVKEVVWQYVSCLYKFLAQKLCHGKKSSVIRFEWYSSHDGLSYVKQRRSKISLQSTKISNSLPCCQWCNCNRVRTFLP